MKWTDLRMKLVEDGLMQVHGKVWDRIYFVRKGKQLSRLPGNMDGNRWRTDPKFENTRGAAREFGAVTKLSKTLRNAVPTAFQQVSGHRELHAKLTGKFLGLLKNAPGQRGTRDLPAELLLSELKEMPWHKKGRDSLFPDAFTRVFHDPLSLKPRIEFKYLPGEIQAPTWATHVRPFCTVIAVSDLTRRKNHHKYTPKHRQYHGQARRVDGEIISLRDLNTKPNHRPQSSFRPHLIFPEAAAGPYTLLVLVGLEAIAYTSDCALNIEWCYGMETAWSGNIEKSTAEQRIQAEYDAKVAEIYPIYAQRIAHLPKLLSFFGENGLEEDRENRKAFEAGKQRAWEIWQELAGEYGIPARGGGT